MMRHCDECRHQRLPNIPSVNITRAARCAKGHAPTFRKPRYPDDRDWGWKRNCDDYRAVADISSAGAALFVPYIVKRPHGGCQVLFPLTELDRLVDEVLGLARKAVARDD